MDFEKVVRQRKIIREYITNKQIPEELIMRLIKNVHRAPSAATWFHMIVCGLFFSMPHLVPQSDKIEAQNLISIAVGFETKGYSLR